MESTKIWQFPRGINSGPVYNRFNIPERVPNNACRNELIKRVGRAITDVNIISKGATFDPTLILNDAPAVNNIATVAIDNGHEMATTPLGSVCDMSYSVMCHENLFNEVAITMTHPAGRLSDELAPNVSTRFIMQRKYDTDVRGATFHLSVSAINAIRQAAAQMQQNIPGLLDNKGSVYDPEIDNKRKKIASEILNLLKVGIAENINNTHHSIALSITDQARSALRRMSVFLPLSRTLTTFKTTLAGLNVHNSDARPWLRTDSTRRTIYEFFNKFAIDQTFAIGKRPDFISEILIAGDECLSNIVTNSNKAPGIFIYPTDGTEPLPMVGCMILPKSVYDRIASTQQGITIKYGKRIGFLPVTLHNESAYHKTENIGQVVISLNNSDADSEDLVGNHPESLLKLIQGNKGEVENELMKMSATGRKIFGTEDEDDEDNKKGDEKRQEVIFKLRVNHDCSYIQTSKGAIVFDVQEERYGHVHEEIDATPSMCHTRNELMHVSVGDVDLDDPIIYSWSADVINTTSQIDLKSAFELFGIMPVRAYTPDVNVSNHEFGARELKQVLMNPLLYAADELMGNLNKQLMLMSNIRSTDSAAQPLFKLVMNKVMIAYRKNEIFKSYIDNGLSKEEEKRLLDIEFHPFFNFTAARNTQANSKVQYETKYRDNYLDFPPYVMPPAMHFLRGNMIMSYLKPNELDVLKNSLSMLPLVNRNSFVNDENVRNIAKIGENLLCRVFSRATSKPSSFFLNGDEIIEKMCVAPLYNEGNIQLVAKHDDHSNTIKTTLTIKDYVTWQEMFDTPHLSTFHNLVRGANIKAIVTAAAANEVLKFCTLLGTIIYINPRSICASVDKGINVGFSVDFFKKETLQAADIIYTKPQSIGMIVIPKPIDVCPLAGGDKNCKFSVAIQTVNNMYGPAGICASAAYPNPSAGDMAALTDSKIPYISLDYVTRSKYRTLNDMLTAYKEEMNAVLRNDYEVDITNVLSTAEAARKGMKSLSSPGVDSAYVGVLRPVGKPTVGAIPYMGIARHEAYDPVNGHNFARFYGTSERSMNPYMSVLGALYNQMFTRSGTVIGQDRSINMHLVTLNTGADTRVCDTTNLLEEAFDLNSGDLSTFDETHSNSFSNLLRCGDPGQQVNLSYIGGSKQCIGSALSKLHISARLGYSVPFTTYTCQNLLKRVVNEGADVIKGRGTARYAKMSPYRIINRPHSLPSLIPTSAL